MFSFLFYKGFDMGVYKMEKLIHFDKKLVLILIGDFPKKIYQMDLRKILMIAIVSN